MTIALIATMLLLASFCFLAGMLVGMGIARRSLSDLERRFARVEAQTMGTYTDAGIHKEVELPPFEEKGESHE